MLAYQSYIAEIHHYTQLRVNFVVKVRSNPSKLAPINSLGVAGDGLGKGGG